jgi:hypothetical protein
MENRSNIFLLSYNNSCTEQVMSHDFPIHGLFNKIVLTDISLMFSITPNRGNHAPDINNAPDQGKAPPPGYMISSDSSTEYFQLCQSNILHFGPQKKLNRRE